jgi:hypothetical protein
MTEGPSINVDEFRHRPVNEIAAICQTRKPSRPRSRIWRLPTLTSPKVRVKALEDWVRVVWNVGAVSESWTFGLVGRGPMPASVVEQSRSAGN